MLYYAPYGYFLHPIPLQLKVMEFKCFIRNLFGLLKVAPSQHLSELQSVHISYSHFEHSKVFETILEQRLHVKKRIS